MFFRTVSNQHVCFQCKTCVSNGVILFPIDFYVSKLRFMFPIYFQCFQSIMMFLVGGVSGRCFQSTYYLRIHLGLNFSITWGSIWTITILAIAENYTILYLPYFGYLCNELLRIGWWRPFLEEMKGTDSKTGFSRYSENQCFERWPNLRFLHGSKNFLLWFQIIPSMSHHQYDVTVSTFRTFSQSECTSSREKRILSNN